MEMVFWIWPSSTSKFLVFVEAIFEVNTEGLLDVLIEIHMICLHLWIFSFLHPADSKNPKLLHWLCEEEIR